MPFLPIDSRHTSVLGYNRGTKSGDALWAELDWSSWWIDGNESIQYLHVRVKHDPRQDGPKKDGHYRQYRVRCRYDIGDKYRGREVYSIGIGFENKQLHWIVRVK